MWYAGENLAAPSILFLGPGLTTIARRLRVGQLRMCEKAVGHEKRHGDDGGIVLVKLYNRLS